MRGQPDAIRKRREEKERRGLEGSLTSSPRFVQKSGKRFPKTSGASGWLYSFRSFSGYLSNLREERIVG